MAHSGGGEEGGLTNERPQNKFHGEGTNIQLDIANY